MICRKPTKKYPEGRQGTYAGAAAHKQAKEPLCDSCLKAYRKYQANKRKDFRDSLGKDGRINRRRLDRYKISTEDYEARVAKQEGKCALCERVPKQPLQIDHDHECCNGQITCGNCIRDLLCIDCNTALGKLLDSPALLRKAANYIEGWKNE